MVPDANSLSIEELPEVATSQNNVEYCLNYNKFYQGRIDHSFCGDGPFCSLKQVLINAFLDSSNAMLVLDGYVMAVIKISDFWCLFDSHVRNSLGIPDENIPRNEVYFFITDPIFLPKMLIADPKNDENFDP